jgi:hypothetical protein
MTYTVPFRLRVLQGLTACLKTITVANGYQFDMAEAVFRGRNVYGDDDPVPLLSILEAPLPDTPSPTPAAGGTWQGPWELMIQGWVDDDKQNPTDPAHVLLADVKKALAEERKKMLRPGSGNNLLGMQGKVTDLIIGACVVRPAEEHVNELANFLLSVTLRIAENMNDPYA